METFRFKKENLRTAIDQVGMTQEEFIDKISCGKRSKSHPSESLATKWISGQKKISPNYYSKVLQVLEGEAKRQKNFEILGGEFKNLAAHEIFTALMEEHLGDLHDRCNLDSEMLYIFQQNYKSVYATIDLDSTLFLYNCIDLSDEQRKELLNFMNSQELSLETLTRKLPLLSTYVEFSSVGFQATKAKFKRMVSRNTTGQARDKAWALLCKAYWAERNNRTRQALIRQLEFITTMDALDWDLLIAYTVLKSNSDKHGCVVAVRERLAALVEQVQK